VRENLYIALHSPMRATPPGRYVVIRPRNLATKILPSHLYIALCGPIDTRDVGRYVEIFHEAENTTPGITANCRHPWRCGDHISRMPGKRKLRWLYSLDRPPKVRAVDDGSGITEKMIVRND
jgi:hypothetical protein